MKHFSALLFIAFAALLHPAASWAQKDVAELDTIFVHTNDGRLHIFPRDMLSAVEVKARSLDLTALDGTLYKYGLGELQSYDRPLQVLLPEITSFKFNNKFNHQVFEDVECQMSASGRIRGTIGAIGKWLSPSIKLSDKRAQIFLDDTARVYSKLSRIHFNEPRTFTVAYPGVQILKEVEVKPAVIEATDTLQTPIPLTVDMLSTNAPSNYPEREDLSCLLDDNPSTFFHSTWGTGAYEKLPEDQMPYIEITLPDAVHTLQYSYMNRNDTGTRSPVALSLFASTDGQDWEEAGRFTKADGLLTDQGTMNVSPVVELREPCSHFRLYMIEASYKNYLCMAELQLYSVHFEHHESSPAEYKYVLAPYGRSYEVDVTWLTDAATAVPRVNIQVENDELVDSKEVYRNATISIDGAGVFPSMEETPVQIKGRGNSSWNNYAWSKNPYRLKFAEKQKPFGLKKGKSWVLLSNRQRGSMMTNAIGMHVAGNVGTEGANHIIPVDLYMNGFYWGSYNFTEKVGLSNNSIDLVDDTNACLLELDTYYDETNKFRTRYYSLPVNIKEPDFSEVMTDMTMADIKERMDTLTFRIQRGMDISDIVDVEALARFLMANELILNFELMHPKSTYLYHENILDADAKFKFGPVWDMDWAYGYESGRNYYQTEYNANYWTSKSNMEAYTFMRRLRNNSGEPLDRAMYKTWTRFMRLHFNELLDFVDEYYAYASPSFENNKNIWSDADNTNYASNASAARSWLSRRARSVYGRLTPYEMTDDEIFGFADSEDPDRTDPYIIDAIHHPMSDGQPARFDVYDLSGVQLKRGATYDTFRSGLKPGLYIVNGRKVLID